MKRTFKKWFALTLAVAMMLSGVPANTVWAEAPQEGEDITADVTVNYVDSEGAEVSPSTVVTAVYGETNIISAIEINGWILKSADDVEVEVDENGVANPDEVVFEYEEEVEPAACVFTVEYRDVNSGEELLPSEEFSVTKGESITFEAPIIEGHIVSGSESFSVDGEFTESTNFYTYIFYYEEGELELPVIENGDIMIEFLDTSGNTLSESILIDSELDTDYTFEAIDIEGFVLISDPTVTVRTTIEEPVAIVRFLYKLIENEAETGEITVSFLTTEDEVLSDAYSFEVPYGEDVSIYAPTFTGYTVVGVDVVEVKLSPSQPNIDIVFVYQAIELPVGKGVVFVYFTDNRGRDLSEPVIMEIGFDEEMKIEAIEIEGYRLTSESSVSVSVTGQEPVVDVIFTYEEIEEEEPIPAPTETVTVTVYHKERNGETLEVEIFEDIEIGERTFKSKNIRNYDVIGSSSKTVAIDSPTTITFEYKKEEPSSGGGGSSSRPSRPSRKDRDDDDDEKEEEKVTKVEEIEKEIIITRNEAKPLTDEIVEVRRSIAKVEIDVEDLEDKQVRAFVFNEDKGMWIPVTTVIDMQEGIVGTLERHTGKVAFFEVEEKVFTDVTENDWFEGYVDRANGFGFINGFDSGRESNFDGDKTLTTAEFYAMVARIFGASSEGEASLYNTLDTVEEVQGANWYEAYENELMKKGYVTTKATAEEMNSEISRIDAMVLLTQLIKDVEDIGIQNAGIFSDADNLNGLGIASSIDGYPDGSLKPFDTLTRAETISLIIKTLESTGW